MNYKTFTFIFLVLIVCFFEGKSQKKIKIDKHTFGAIEARHIGPAVMSGRISAIDAVDCNPDIMYVGAASGGLWKSKNQGITFKPVFDKYCQSIGAIRIDQIHPDTVWVGTGEPWVRNSVSVGTGLYKSIDGGENWKLMGLKNTERIGHIEIHPQNRDIVYVAALGHLWGPNKERGLYKTIDGGKTWEQALFIDENTGCTDVAIDPDNPETIYTTMWEFRRSPYFFNSGGKGSGLYKSTDSGKNWKKVTNDLPKGELGRLSIDISPVDHNIIYLLVEAEKSGLYRSDDRGESWKMVNNTQSVTQRPFYFSLIKADPVDTNLVYKPGFHLNVSTNKGKNFQVAYIEGGRVHPDHHALYISPNNNKILYAGTDGGVYISNDKGSTWRMARNLPLSQFYHVAVDMEKPYNVYGGLQDNGSWYGPSRKGGGITNANWESMGFGDGFNVIPDKEDNSLVYWQFQGGNIGTYNKKTGELKAVKPYKEEDTDDLRFNWNTPLVFSPTSNVLYTGAQYLYKSDNKGESWQRISPDLTTNNPEKLQQEKTGGLTIDNSSAENHCTIITINESLLDKNIIWVGTDDGNLQVTKDGGKTWENVIVNVTGVPANTWVSYVESGHFEKGVCYVTFDGHKSGDKTPYVFKTTDFGKTWKALAGKGIDSYCHLIKEDLKEAGLLFLGTEFGLFVSIDGGEKWSQFTGNLPKVSVRDMVIHPREHDLVLGTHGRGVMIIDDITPLRNLSKEILQKDVAFIPSRDFIIPENGMRQGWTGDDEFVGRNPREAAMITYYMRKRHIFGDMSIEIYDKEGNLLKELPAGKRRGINRVPWVIRMDPPKVPSSPQLSGFAMMGPTYGPGEYTVKLKKGDDVYESKITLKLNPDSPHSENDRLIRQKTVMQAYNLLEHLAYVDGKAKGIMEKAEELSKKVKSKGTAKKLKNIAAEMEKRHKKLVATREGYITGESQLREKISYIYGCVVLYFGKPTDSQIQRLNDLEKEVKAIESEIETILDKNLAKINKSLAKESQKEIVPIKKEEYLKKK